MLSIRESTAQDGAAILRIASAEPLFSRQEAEMVAELLHDYLERADHNGYFFLTAESDGALLGFACYGPTPSPRELSICTGSACDETCSDKAPGKLLCSTSRMKCANRPGG